MQDSIKDYFETIRRFLNTELFAIGETHVTLSTLVFLIVAVVTLIFVSGQLKKLLIRKILQRTQLDVGAQQAIGTIFRYVLIFTGFLIILQTAGIDLTALHVIAGAVGIGLGFGLQNIANNFVSGLIILFERPVKVGDRIEVEKAVGIVKKIGPRSTVVMTNDNISMIVPNSKFISETVVNWGFSTNPIPVQIPVNVPYNSDLELVQKLLMDIATSIPDVADQPSPSVILSKLGDGMLEFELRVWTKIRLDRPSRLKSAINLEIVRRFLHAGIIIEPPAKTGKTADAGGEGSVKLSN